MNNPKLLQEKQKVDDLFIQIQGFSGDAYYQSLMTYYLCIRVSGFIENCVRIILAEYSLPRAQGTVGVYVTNTLMKLPNPTFHNLCRLAAQFDDQWRKSFKAAATQQARQSLKSINLNRNNLAHGGNSTMTLRELAGYYHDVLALVDELERVCV